MEEKIALVLQIEGGGEAVREINRLDDGIKDLGGQIKSLRSDSRQTQKELENTTKRLSELAKEGKKNSEEYQELSKRSEELNKVLSSNTKQIDDLRVSQRSLREERKAANSELNKQIRDLRKYGQAVPEDSQEAFVRRTAELRKELRLTSREIIKISDEFDKNSRALDGLDTETLKAVKRYRELKKEVRENREEAQKFDRNINDFTSTIGNYTTAFNNLDLGGFISRQGPGSQIANILSSTTQGLTNLRESAAAIGPAGLALGGIIAGATAAGKAIVETTLKYEKLFATVNRQTGLEGSDLQQATALIDAISNTLENVEFEDLLTSLNSATQGFGGDILDNGEIIQQGLFGIGTEKGREQFLDDLREYPRLINDAGLSLEEFTKLSVIQNREGFLNDKLVDATKESLINLTDFTSNVRQQLNNVLGEDFTKDLESRIRTGETVAKDAVIEIGDALIESGADQQDYQRITAAVASSAGEDIGGIVEIYESLREVQSSTLEELTRSTTAYSERQLALFEAEKELSKQNTILAAQFAGQGTSFDALTTKAKAFGKSLLNDVILNVRAIGRTFKEDGILAGFQSLFDPRLNQVTVNNLREEDAEALTKQTEIENKQQEERDKLAEQEAKRERARIKRAREDAEAKKKLNKEIAKQEREETKRRREEQKKRDAIEKANQKAIDDNFKLEQNISDLRAKNDEKTLADISEFNRQIQQLNEQEQSDINAIDPLLDPERVSDQQELLEEKYEELRKALRLQREKILKENSRENFDNLINESQFTDASRSLDAINEFNSTVSEDPSLKVREEAEKKLQRRLIEIQLEGLQERKALITNSTILTEEEKIEQLTAIANQEKQLNFEKNKEILENQEEAARKIEELQKQVATANEKAVGQIGEALGNFLVESTQDSEEAFKNFAKGIGEILLDLIGQQLTLLATSAFSQPDSVASFGASGALRVALITGLIRGSISGLKNLIGTFEEGGRIGFPSRDGGLIQGPSHKDGGVKFFMKGAGQRFFGEAEGGEVILNADQQKKGAQMFGPDYLDRMGVPDTHNIFSNIDYIPQLGYDFYNKQAGAPAAQQNSADIESAIKEGISEGMKGIYGQLISSNKALMEKINQNNVELFYRLKQQDSSSR